MIRPDDVVRTMTGRLGTVLATDVSVRRGCERAVRVRIGPLLMHFHACDDTGIIPAVCAYYHPDDLTSIAEEPPLCSPRE